MKALILAALAALVLVSVSRASGTLELSSNLPARVYLDAEFVGYAPLVLEDVAGGQHVLRIEETSDNHARVYHLMLPKHSRLQRAIHASFSERDPAVVVIDSPPVQSSGRRTYASQARGHADARTRSRVRVRNVGLGVGALGLLTGKGMLTGIGLGTALVNEVVNR